LLRLLTACVRAPAIAAGFGDLVNEAGLWLISDESVNRLVEFADVMSRASERQAWAVKHIRHYENPRNKSRGPSVNPVVLLFRVNCTRFQP
jgi:hypothetical protein